MSRSTDPLKPPRRPPWRSALDGVTATFLTGLLSLLPIFITLMIVDWVIRQIAGLFGEDTILGSAITGSSHFLFGDGWFGVFLISMLVVAAIWFAGRILQTRARASMEERLDRWIDKIPIIGGIYRPVAKITRMIGMREEQELASMRPISCRFGGEESSDVLALLASDKPLFIGGKPRMLVYIPSAPLPMTGALVLVPPENVVEVPGLALEDLLKYYVSLGTVLPPELEARTDAALARMIAEERRRMQSASSPEPGPESPDQSV